MFWKKKPAGKNKELNALLLTMQQDAANNYKDAAQLDYKRVKELYARLLDENRLSAREIAYYEEQLKVAEKEMAHFTHFEGPGTGLYNR